MLNLTVPDYYSRFINDKVDLNCTPKVCCPFHKEETPSFSYNQKTGRWRCFGSCKTGGDVIDLHRMNYKLKTREEAEISLRKLLGLRIDKISSLEQIVQHVSVDTESVELNRIYNLCLMYANSVERWLDLDYAMSIYPVDIYRLKDILKKWGVQY